MTLRWLKRILLGVFLLLLALMSSISALVATESGSRWVIGKIVQLLPENLGTLEVGELKGNLLTGLDASYFDYRQVRDQQVHQSYRAEQVSFRWQPLALLYRSVSVQSLQADNITLMFPRAKDQPDKEFTWPRLALPVQIELGDVQLRDIHIRRGEQTLYHIQSLKGSVRLGNFNLRMSDLALTTAAYGVTLSGRTGVRFPYASDWSVQWHYQVSQGQINRQASVAGQTNPSTPRVSSAAGDPAAGDPAAGQQGSPEQAASAADQVTASAGDGANAKQPGILRFSGKGKLRGDIKKLLVEHDLLTPFVIQTTGSFLPNLVQQQDQPRQSPYLDIDNQWSDQLLLARWFPPTQSPPVTSARLTLTGWLNDYHGLLDGTIARDDIGEFAVQADARGNLRDINIAELIIQQRNRKQAGPAETARVKARGKLAWSPTLNWDLQLEADQLNPAVYFPAWPGDISLALATRGSYNRVDAEATKRLSLSLRELKLAGQLRSLAVSGAGDLAYDGQGWQSEELRVSLGANQIILAGNYSDQINVQWQLEAPLLAQLDPQLSGSLSTHGNLQGSIAKPNLQVVAQGEDLQWRNYSLDKLHLDLGRDGNGRYQLVLDAADVRLGAQRLKQVTLAGAGTRAQHNLQGKIASTDYGRVEFAMDSRYQNRQWQGKFSDLQLRVKKIPRWQLSRSEWMSVSATEAIIGEQCLTTRAANSPRSPGVNPAAASGGKPSAARATASAETAGPQGPASAQAQAVSGVVETPNLCITGKWSLASGSEFLAKVQAVPLRQARALLKPNVTLGGVIDGDISFRLPAPGASSPAMEGRLELQTRDGELRYQYASEEPNVYRWRSAQLQADISKNLLNSELVIDWAEYGNINATASVNLLQQEVDGKLKLDFSNLSPFETVIPFAENITGRLAADMAITGKLHKPEVTGEATLTEGTAQLPGLGIELREMAMSLASRAGGNINWQSSVTSGKGKVALSGALNNLGTPDWALAGRLEGEDFQIIKQQQLKANITPAINLKANAREIRLDGSAKIPYARADIKSLPATATRVSPDVVIVDGEEGTADQVAGIPLFANMTIELGKDVHFKGFGLDSKLEGRINIVQAPPRVRITTGYVSVVDGKYEAYGQELEIERGRLSFQGPYENPGLDISAVRKTPDYPEGVGLEIGGTLQKPTSRIRPAEGLTDSESMAILLTGKPLKEASAGEAYALYSVLSGSGMNAGPGIKENITQALHVDELAIQADDDEGFKQSSLLVGKQLSPRLFVRYVVGLFDQAFSIGVTYQMTDRLRLEAESGEAQSIDMIYKIER